MAKWRDIKHLTDAHMEIGSMEHRLLFWNGCNGPHMPLIDETIRSADSVKRDGCWEKFLIIPPATT